MDPVAVTRPPKKVVSLKSMIIIIKTIIIIIKMENDHKNQKNAAFHPPELEVPEMPSKGECGCPPG